MPHGVKTIKSECFDCKAEYTGELVGDGNVLWPPVMDDAPCANPDCTGKIALWPDEVRPGIYVDVHGMRGRFGASIAGRGEGCGIRT